jgi:hypothetical protein
MSGAAGRGSASESRLKNGHKIGGSTDPNLFASPLSGLH